MEICNLNDMCNSYNSILNRIEVLNEKLKQAMDDFETKNMELMKLGEERTDFTINLQTENKPIMKQRANWS